MRLQIDTALDSRLPPPDPRTRVAPALILMVMLRSLILSTAPLYSVSEWAASMLPAALVLTAEQAAALNDDRFACEPTSFMPIPGVMASYPLVTNRPNLSPLKVYISYHCNQSLVEKRHDLLKNILNVTPAFLHSVSRLEALLFPEYLAVTVHAPATPATAGTHYF